MVNYYTILGLTRNATQDEIKSAYRNLCLKYHPDKCKLQNATQMFQTIEEAYEVLSDEEKKRIFDSTLDENTANPNQQQEATSEDDEEFEEFVKKANRANARNKTVYNFSYAFFILVIIAAVIAIVGGLGWLFVKYVWPYILKALVYAFIFLVLAGFAKMFDKK